MREFRTECTYDVTPICVLTKIIDKSRWRLEILRADDSERIGYCIGDLSCNGVQGLPSLSMRNQIYDSAQDLINDINSKRKIGFNLAGKLRYI